MSTTGGSRLAEMQARFQQRQLIEKEQKLLKIFEANQAKALGRLGAAQSPPAPPGKVRQMFEERRTKAGIDKSYPLQPLATNNKAATNNRLNGHNLTLDIKQTSTTTTTTNGDCSTVRSQRVTVANVNNNHGDGDDHEPQTVMNRLPNVGRSLAAKRPDPQQPINNNNNNPNSQSKSRPAPTNGRPKQTPAVVKTPPQQQQQVSAPRQAATRTPSSTASPKPRPPGQTQSRSGTAETVVKTPPGSKRVATPPTPQTPPSQGAAVKTSRTFAPSSGGEGEACSVCQRRFASDRIAKHEQICAKTAAKKRKVYDAVKHRVAGTEVESYVRTTKKGGRGGAGPAARAAPSQQQQQPAGASKSNWRKKHEEFIQAIRAAKQVQAHLSKGGKLSDLPPPPPSDTSDYVACPHCGRRFNQGAAERHIPKCANFQFNKPKPKRR